MSDDLRTSRFERTSSLLASLTDPASLGADASSACGTDRRACAPLERLCDTLDAILEASAKFPESARSTFFARSMRIALADAAGDPDLLSPEQREGSAERYRRHLLAADPLGRYAVAALVWQPGQASPVHGHHTWCSYAVVDGELSETIYEWNDAQACANPLRSQARKRGAVSFVRGGRGAIHQLGNSSKAAAVSLHVYGVEGARIGTGVNDIVRVADPAVLV
ncbi:cysteine dioxygenase family protein [Paraburkholderia sp. ZP32-5]|uniref:cysteine dioxygenase family protein n=1 Tax=Paraburkholderia sp. ZP32-5 TaxID=2883245 RepID=UPI001F1DDCB1|nr:cysteine dioxygenase family protein [Paraburkholderia sp. ZP32-5]